MFKEVPDDLWQRIAPLLLPFQRKHSGRGSAAHRLRGRFRRCVDNTACLSASPCVRIPSLTDSTAWGMLPNCYGSKSAVHEHFQRWRNAGVFDRVFRLCLDAVRLRALQRNAFREYYDALAVRLPCVAGNAFRQRH